MKTIAIATSLLLGVLLSGCATGYQKATAFTLTGGYQEKDLGQNVYRVTFGANGYTSQETTQSFWLYRCAQLTLEKGFDGFEILSDIRLVKAVSPYEAFGIQEPTFQPAQYYPVIVPMYDIAKPYIEADILLLKSGDFTASPPRIFDARKLISALEPHVAEPIKGRGNVKPHIHEYLMPEGKFKKQNEQGGETKPDAI